MSCSRSVASLLTSTRRRTSWRLTSFHSFCQCVRWSFEWAASVVMYPTSIMRNSWTRRKTAVSERGQPALHQRTAQLSV